MKTEIKVNELASLSNLTPRRVRQLAEEGKIPKITRGKLPMPGAVVALFAHYQKVSEEMTGQRLKLLSATRETRELELDQAKGKFIERAAARAVVEGALRKYHGFVKAELENSGPQRRQKKLAELGADAGAVGVFHEFDVIDSQAVIDRIEARCEQETREADAICI